MRRLFAIAWRNLARNPRRTGLTAASLFVGVAFVVFLEGFFNGFIRAVIASSVDTHVAAIQVHRTGFAAADALQKNMSDDLALIIEQVPGVTAAAPRIGFEGFINNGTRAAVFFALGVDPESEGRACPRRHESLQGKSFPNDNAVFVGRELARSIDAFSGGNLSLLSTTSFGKQNALDVDFAGDMHFDEPFVGKRAVLTTLAFAQRLLRLPGRATEYAVAVQDLAAAPLVAQAIGDKLGPDYRVDTWRQRDEGIAVLVDRTSAVFYAVALVLLALVLSGIANTMLMSMHERGREIGTMLAVGTRRAQILVLVLCEAVQLSMISASAGALCGAAIVRGLQHVGIALTPPGQPAVLVFPFVSAADVATVVVLSVLGALLAALWPAYRASRLSPVEALAVLE